MRFTSDTRKRDKRSKSIGRKRTGRVGVYALAP